VPFRGADGEKGNTRMTLRFRARPGRRLAIAIASAVFALSVVAASGAFAADTSAPPSVSDIIQQLTNAPVQEAACTAVCHDNIAATKNYASEIKFSHGNHILIQCSGCHARFPHRKTGTEKPTMKSCFNCHGVRHGPRGILAKDACTACHNTPRWRLRPAFHGNTWAFKPHVQPAYDELNTKCMMCHKTKDCTDCHDKKAIVWQPKAGWDYDPGQTDGVASGCLACHGDATLLKAAGNGTRSFQVTGIEDSAHRGVTCQQCHPDYRYNDKVSATKMWSINAGLACATCHQTAKKAKDREPVNLYEMSVHAKKIREGDYESATCGSCHGGHFIYRLDTADAKSRMHASAYRTCARCHAEAYGTYDDYYHGQPYKNGAADSPACWQCHEAHDVLPQADQASSVSDKNISATCGQKGCHTGSSQKFGTDASQLIHRKAQAQKDNPLMQLIARAKGMIGL